MSEIEQPQVVEDGYTDEIPEPELTELPPRRRRDWRLLTPVTGLLLAVLIAACGFIAGALVEKGDVSGGSQATAGAAAAGGAARRAGAFGGPAQGPGGGATFGQVSNVRGRTLYVAGPQGNTVKVVVAKGVPVSRSESRSIGAVHPGDTVVVQGSPAGDGSIHATSVRATAASASGAGGGGGGGRGGGGALSQLFGGGGGG